MSESRVSWRVRHPSTTAGLVARTLWLIAFGCSEVGVFAEPDDAGGLASTVTSHEESDPPSMDAGTHDADASSLDASSQNPDGAAPGEPTGDGEGSSTAGTTREPWSTEPNPTAGQPDAGSVVTEPFVGPGLTDVEQYEPVACNISARVELSSNVSTVGIATFETDLAGADAAVIQFGTDGAYVYEAPVDWEAPGHRTLLLGNPTNSRVAYRVLVFDGERVCVGPHSSFETGGPALGAPASVAPLRGPSTAQAAPGFILAVRGEFAHVVDKRGRVVWAYRFPTTLTRAHLSWDGRYVYARDLGPFNSGTGGSLFRVDIDGSDLVRLELTGGSHHDFTVTPSGITYIAKPSVGACDHLYTADADGANAEVLVDLGVVFDRFDEGPGAIAPERCHVNYVRYYPSNQSYSVSDREKDVIALVSGSGALLGSVGATPRETTPNHIVAQGAGESASAPWRVQHGHDLYAPNKLVLWSNGTFVGGTSRLLHYTLEGNTAKLDWQYTGAGTSPTLSDAQYLPNGNYMATNSGRGDVLEVDASQRVVLEFSNLTEGYTSHLPDLYGHRRSSAEAN